MGRNRLSKWAVAGGLGELHGSLGTASQNIVSKENSKKKKKREKGEQT